MKKLHQHPSHQQPTLPEALQPEVTTLDKWWRAFSEPIQLGPRFPVELQDTLVESLELVVPPVGPDIDVAALLSPVPHWRKSYGVA